MPSSSTRLRLEFAKPDAVQEPDGSGASGGEKMLAEIIRTERVFPPEEVVGDLAQPPRQRAGHIGDVGARVFANDGAYGIDMLVEERDRDAGRCRGVCSIKRQRLSATPATSG